MKQLVERAGDLENVARGVGYCTRRRTVRPSMRSDEMFPDSNNKLTMKVL
jgi:hypothetical protein